VVSRFKACLEVVSIFKLSSLKLGNWNQYVVDEFIGGGACITLWFLHNSKAA
jgi:hypothetical protein